VLPSDPPTRRQHGALNFSPSGASMETMQIILRLVGSLSGAGGKSPVEATVKNLAAR